MKIIENVSRCNLCGDIIESTNPNEIVWCKCGSCAVQGGHDHLGRYVKEENCYTDISIIERSAKERKGNNKDINVIVYLPKSGEALKEIRGRLARIHAQYVLSYIQNLRCPQWQKEKLLDAVINKVQQGSKEEEKNNPLISERK